MQSLPSVKLSKRATGRRHAVAKSTSGGPPRPRGRGHLKPAGRASDGSRVAPADPSCPICNADIPTAGDEAAGEEIFCTYCGSPCRLVPKDDDPDEWDAVEGDV